MQQIQFENAAMLLALPLVLIVAGAIWALSFKRRRSLLNRYADAQVAQGYLKPLSMRSEILAASSWLLVVTLLVVALASPVKKDGVMSVAEGALAVVAVTDNSLSMAAEDYREFMPDRNGVKAAEVPGPYGSRLDIVKRAIRTELINQMRGNRLSVVTYSGAGFVQAPLTDDFHALSSVLERWVKPNVSPEAGSNYVAGLYTALDVLSHPRAQGKEKLIVLFTDGGFTGQEGTIPQAVQRLKESGVKLVIVAVGHAESDGTLIPLYSSSGEKTGYLSEGGENILAPVEMENLEELAGLAGTSVTQLTPDGRLELSLPTLLSKSTRETNSPEQLYRYPLLSAMALMAVLFLRDLRPRKRTGVRGVFAVSRKPH